MTIYDIKPLQNKLTEIANLLIKNNDEWQFLLRDIAKIDSEWQEDKVFVTIAVSPNIPAEELMAWCKLQDIDILDHDLLALITHSKPIVVEKKFHDVTVVCSLNSLGNNATLGNDISQKYSLLLLLLADANIGDKEATNINILLQQHLLCVRQSVKESQKQLLSHIISAVPVISFKKFSYAKTVNSYLYKLESIKQQKIERAETEMHWLNMGSSAKETAEIEELFNQIVKDTDILTSDFTIQFKRNLYKTFKTHEGDLFLKCEELAESLPETTKEKNGKQLLTSIPEEFSLNFKKKIYRHLADVMTKDVSEATTFLQDVARRINKKLEILPDVNIPEFKKNIDIVSEQGTTVLRTVVRITEPYKGSLIVYGFSRWFSEARGFVMTFSMLSALLIAALGSVFELAGESSEPIKKMRVIVSLVSIGLLAYGSLDARKYIKNNKQMAEEEDLKKAKKALRSAIDSMFSNFQSDWASLYLIALDKKIAEIKSSLKINLDTCSANIKEKEKENSEFCKKKKSELEKSMRDYADVQKQIDRLRKEVDDLLEQTKKSILTSKNN